MRQQVNLTQVEQRAIATASQDYDAAQRLSRYLTRSTPPYNAGEEEGVDNLIACFKYEYPSKLQFAFLPADHDDRNSSRTCARLRSSWSSCRNPNQDGAEASKGQTMDTMLGPEAALALPVTPAAKRTAQERRAPAEQYPPPAQEPRRPAAFMPFDSQEAMEKAIVEAKIAYIHAGGTP